MVRSYNQVFQLIEMLIQIVRGIWVLERTEEKKNASFWNSKIKLVTKGLKGDSKTESAVLDVFQAFRITKEFKYIYPKGI